MSSPIGPTLPRPCLLSHVPCVVATVVKFYWEEKKSRWGWFCVRNGQSMSHPRKLLNQILSRCEHPQVITLFGPTQLMNVVIARSHLKSTFARVCPKTCPLVNPKATLGILQRISRGQTKNRGKFSKNPLCIHTLWAMAQPKEICTTLLSVGPWSC